MISYQLNAGQRKTLQLLFERPTRADVRWLRIEGLILALGGEVSEGRGSRVRFHLRDRVAVFHRPHPGPVAGKALVDDVRRFLENAGIRP